MIDRMGSRAVNDRKTTTIKVPGNYSVGDRIQGHGEVHLRVTDIDLVDQHKAMVKLENEAGEWWTILSVPVESPKAIFAVIHPIKK